MIKVRICSGYHELNQPRVVEQNGKFFSLWDIPVEVRCGLTGFNGCKCHRELPIVCLGIHMVFGRIGSCQGHLLRGLYVLIV